MSFRQIPAGFRLFMQRSAVVPFEVAFGVIAMWSGAISFFDVTISSQALKVGLPIEIGTAFNLMYILAGAFIVAGVGWHYRNVEASGMVLLFTTLVVRIGVFVFVIGFVPQTTAAIVQGFIFGFAAVIRLLTLLKNKVLVLTEITPNGDHQYIQTKVSI